MSLAQRKLAQRKYRLTKKLMDAPALTIGFITGNSLPNGVMDTKMLLLPSPDFIKFLCTLDLELPDWPMLRCTRKIELNYDLLTRGCMGVLPPTLLVNLLRDLKEDTKGTSLMKWSRISKKGYESRDGKGQYYMFHWVQGGGVTYRGVQQDWKDGVRILSSPTRRQIDNFGCFVMRKLKPQYKLVSKEVIMEAYSFYPGCVSTGKAYHQRAHIDLDRWGLVIHAPLCLEGMMVLVWPADSRHKPGVFIHVPFGSFLALPSNVVHAGVYGNPGNIRFHMIVRMRNSLWLEDGLLDRDCYNGEEVYEQRPPWSPAFDRLGVKTKDFSDSFVVMLEQKFGGFFEREWVENNLKLK
jgi:hypothetical protein